MSDRIHIDQLHPSPTQPRKNFKQSEHEELTASMVEHGFAFGSLLLRPRPEGGFEIIIGERRTRAAKDAITELRKRELAPEILERIGSLEYPPQRVRELSDTKVRELQLIENLQRSDLNPIEEAEGYRGLLDLRDESSGKPLHTIETIATRIGRDRTKIERSLMLCNLGPEPRAEVEAGRLDESIAYYIARIPDVRLRDEASRAVLHPEFEEGPLTQRRAQEEIAKLVRDLRKARFDAKDPSLVPLRTDAEGNRVCGGACSDCPFRFADKQRTSCLNPSCYDEKTEAEWTEWQSGETDEAKKRRALSRDDCADLFSKQFPDQPTWSSGLVALDQSPAGDELRPGEESPGPWRTVTEGAELEILVARDRNYRTQELVKRETAIAAAKMNGFDVFKITDREKRSSETRASLGIEAPADLTAEEGKSLEQTREQWLNQSPTKDERDSRRRQSEKERTETEERQREIVYACLSQLRKKGKPSTAFLRKVALAIFAARGAHEDLLKRYKLPVAADISRNVARWRDADFISFIVELLITDAGYNFDLDDDDRSWFKPFGIDPAKIEKSLAKQN